MFDNIRYKGYGALGVSGYFGLDGVILYYSFSDGALESEFL